ncbi:MAG: large repetitive protein [Solirubrobacterales bacterium]|jgi:hypothetical protein|nr:large repetitive protein [Solirubrobacterales bacterium]
MMACVVWMASSVAPASADHHLMSIREVFPGTIADTSFVELQMYAAGQNLVGDDHVVVYGPTGAQIDSYAFPSDVADGHSQRTVLLGDTAASGAPDFTDSGLNIPPTGGAVCFISDTYPDNEALDCVTWGNFTGTVPDLATGNPASPAGVTAGKSLERRIDRGCATLLDVPADMTFDSAADFTEQTPSPRNNLVTPTETGCPETAITGNPTSPTNRTNADFSFNSPGNAPGTPGLSFQCKLDSEPSFSACTSTKSYAGPLGAGPHTFSVRAVLNGVEDPTPATYPWVIDLSPPDTTITPATKPASPTTSQTANFGFTSSEPDSTFTCKLDTGPLEGCSAGAAKSYSGLASGSHTFTVFATDLAGNKDDAAPATHTWIIDRIPPDTTIDSGPQQPVSTVNSADFTYHAEAGATFKCKLDTGAEVDCNTPGGISYTNIPDGVHTFKVYGIDALANSETLAGAATYTWTVDAVVDPPDPPDTTIIKPPKKKGTDKTPTITFEATILPATFQCRVDQNNYASCTSPHTTQKLKPGKHTFDVYATAGAVDDPTPARASFKIVKKR